MRWRLERTTGVTALLLSIGVFLTTAGPLVAADAEPAQLEGAVLSGSRPEESAEAGDTLPSAAENMAATAEPAALAEAELSAAASAEPVRLLVYFADLAAGTALSLTGPDGAEGALSTPTSGELTLTLRPGRWRIAVAGREDVWFTLAENASVSNVSGAGWTDGESLTLSQSVCGSLTVAKTPPTDAGETQYLYRLDGASADNDCRALAFSPESEPTQYCTFWALPTGSYTLYENDIAVASVLISADDPAQTVTLG